MAAATHADIEAQVRSLWAAYARGGAAAMRSVVDDDVEWVPLAVGAAVPADDLYGDWGRRQAELTSVLVHGYERRGDCVLVHGSMRTFRAGGFVDVQPSWVYFFRTGRLRRAVGYATREEALEAIGAYATAG